MGHDAELLAVAGVAGGTVTLQDFTTFTAVDSGGIISVDSAIQVTATDVPRNADNYLYKDFGAGFFAGDFVHEFEYVPIAQTAGLSYGWALTNTLDDIGGIKVSSGDCLAMYVDSVGSYRLLAWEIYGGTNAFSATQFLTQGVRYYMRIRRDEAVGTFGTLYIDVFTNSARTALLVTLSVTLHAKNDFRYLHAVQSNNSATPGQIRSHETKNLDLIS